MQGQRYWIERALQQGHQDVGLGDYQVRDGRGWHHHLALVMMAMLFLLEECQLHQQPRPLSIPPIANNNLMNSDKCPDKVEIVIVKILVHGFRAGWVWRQHHAYYSIETFRSGDGRQRDRGEAMHERKPTRRRPVLYLVYATPLDGGPTVEDAVAASDEDDAYEKARALYPRDRFNVTVYLQSADDD